MVVLAISRPMRWSEWQQRRKQNLIFPSPTAEKKAFAVRWSACLLSKVHLTKPLVDPPPPPPARTLVAQKLLAQKLPKATVQPEREAFPIMRPRAEQKSGCC